MTDIENRDHTSFNELYHRENGVNEDFSYDDNGNLTTDAEYAYEWDARNRLRRATRRSDGVLIAVYSYDAAGRRTRQVVQNSSDLDGTTHFVYDGWQVLEERDGSGALAQQYVYGATYIDEVLVLDRNLDGDGSATGVADERLWYHQNSLYSVYTLTDESGETVEGYLYDAYGEQAVYEPGSNGIVDFGGDDSITTDIDSNVGNSYFFTGRRLEPEVMLYNYRNRYLSGETGRFLSRDPLGDWADPENFGNGYTYVGNSPVEVTDPSGLQRRGQPCCSRWQDVWQALGYQSHTDCFTDCWSEIHSGLSGWFLAMTGTSGGIVALAEKKAASVAVGARAAVAGEFVAAAFAGVEIGTSGGCAIWCELDICTEWGVWLPVKELPELIGNPDFIELVDPQCMRNLTGQVQAGPLLSSAWACVEFK